MLNLQEVSNLFPKLAPLALPSQYQPSARFGDTSRQPRMWGQFRIEGGHFSTDDVTTINPYINETMLANRNKHQVHFFRAEEYRQLIGT